ncbi:MAG: tRNA pseudouridine(38-40) synthase TruA [Candidatus Bathyarchaeia archaeon]
MRNIKLVIEYDGTNYHGWQVQPGVPTIQGVLEDAINRITQYRSRLIGSGRTDAGVHALNQVANFLTPSSLPPEVLKRALNALLPEDIVTKEAEEVPVDFHARYDAKRKRYSYRILRTEMGSAFHHRYCWMLPYHLDVEAMNEACKYLMGIHDFSSFPL